jgi:hypothetical protein
MAENDQFLTSIPNYSSQVKRIVWDTCQKLAIFCHLFILHLSSLSKIPTWEKQDKNANKTENTMQIKIIKYGHLAGPNVANKLIKVSKYSVF